MVTTHEATRLLEITHDLSVRLIELADAKASVVVGFASVLAGILVQELSNSGPLIGTLLVSAGFTLGALSSVLGVAAILPRTKIDSTPPPPLFYKRIIGISLIQYRADSMKADKAALDEALVLQNYSLAKIQDRKYALLQAAFATFMGGLILGLAGLAVGRAIGP